MAFASFSIGWRLRNPVVYILLAALVVTVSIQSWGNAIVIGIVLMVNATIGFIQKYRAETAVQSLMEMVSPKASVRSDRDAAPSADEPFSQADRRHHFSDRGEIPFRTVPVGPGTRDAGGQGGQFP